MLWSSGMPILYFIGFLWFTVTFLTNKLLLLKYYQRTLTNTKDIPLFSAEFLKIGIVQHIFVAAFMLTNPHPFKTEEQNTDPIITFNMIKDTNYFKDLYDRNKDSSLFSRF